MDCLSTIRPISTEVIFHGAGAQSLAHLMTRAALEPGSPSVTMFAKVTAEAASTDAPAPARARLKP